MFVKKINLSSFYINTRLKAGRRNHTQAVDTLIKIDTLIRKVCRQALGISEYASKELLLQL